MKRFILFFSICWLATASCDHVKDRQKSKLFVAKVKVNETDCFRCFGGTHAIRELSEISHVELVFRNIGKNEVLRFMELNGMGDGRGELAFDVISDSSSYNALDEYGNSELHVFDNGGRELFATRLDSKSLERTIGEMRTLNREITRTSRPKLNLKYGSGILDLSVSHNRYLVTNRSMNYCEVFDGEGQCLFAIDALKIDPLEIFPDLREKDPYIHHLKKMGTFTCRIESARLVGDEVLLKAYVPYVEIRHDSIIQETRSCMISYYEEDGVWSWRLPCDPNVHHIEAMGNAKEENDYFGISRNPNEEDHLSYKSLRMKVVDGTTMIIETKAMAVPDFDRIPNFAYEPKIKDGAFALGYTNFIYDLENDTAYQLPINCNPTMTCIGTKSFNISTDGHVVDWAFKDDVLSIVFYDAKSMQCQYISKDTKLGETSITPLSFGPDLKCPVLCLASTHVLYYLDSKNEVQVMPVF